MCIPLNLVAATGASRSLLFVGNIYEWAPLPMLLSFLFFLLCEKFNLNVARCFKVFILGVSITVGMFFLPFTIDGRIFLYSGLVIISVLAILHYRRMPNLDLRILFLSVPVYVFYIAGSKYGFYELGLFAGYTASGLLILGFEAAKNDGSATLISIRNRLKAAEVNFSKLFSIIPDPAVIVDKKGTFIAITPHVPTLTGYSKEELIGSNFMRSKLVSAESKIVLIKNLAKRMMGIQIAPYEIEIRSKDGKKMQFELNAMKIDYQGMPADMVVFRDLTERKKLIETLEQEQVRFKTIAQSSGDWIWEINKKGLYTYSNSVVEKILGYSAAEIIGKEYFSSTSTYFEDNTQATIRNLLCNSSLPIIKYCRCKDGRISVLESQAFPIFSRKGRIIGYRGVDRDITEKKELEDRLVKSERLAAIGELATMVAHDLRNPLQGISNGLFFIKRATKDVDNAAKLKPIIGSMEKSISYSAKILTDLLDFSREIILYRAKTTPVSMVENALESISIPENVKLVNTITDNQEFIVDVDKMNRVITNIIKNAIDAMSKGGSLEIFSRIESNNFELYFKDTGSGIPKQKMDKLWVPFVTTKAQGMGLGLPICKRIIEAHGGEILVDTVEGKGTTFCLQLPLSNIMIQRSHENQEEEKIRVSTRNLSEDLQDGIKPIVPIEI
jgi:PAS domain S-box-containing protein